MSIQNPIHVCVRRTWTRHIDAIEYNICIEKENNRKIQSVSNKESN